MGTVTSARRARTKVGLAEARRIALAAQGFADPRPTGRPDGRWLRRVLNRVGLLQIDSVNVLSRAHYLPLWSRSGGYPTELLDAAAGRAPRRLFEYWAHAASLIDVRTQPALRHRMERIAARESGRIRRLERERPGLVDWVRQEVRDRGPITARDVGDDAPRKKDHWGWNWSDVKIALEWLFDRGEISSAGRNGAFERRYDLTERVLPRDIVNAPTPTPQDAERELIRIAGSALGVASDLCLRDYFRLRAATANAAIAELVEAGELIEVEVEGWKRPTYLAARATAPRRLAARALVGPFDSMVFERERLETLFGFRYRIEIYVPPPKRTFGYYVLPFLLGDRFVARVDLKADRAAGLLRVQSAFAEPDAPAETAEELAAELTAMAEWMSLDGVAVAERGDLVDSLRRMV